MRTKGDLHCTVHAISYDCIQNVMVLPVGAANNSSWVIVQSVRFFPFTATLATAQVSGDQL
jgi:hypothetical protein